MLAWSLTDTVGISKARETAGFFVPDANAKGASADLEYPYLIPIFDSVSVIGARLT